MRNFLKIFLMSLGTYLGSGGGLTRPSFIVGFPRLVILVTYSIKYFTMEAVSLVCVLALNLTSSTMCQSVAFEVEILGCNSIAETHFDMQCR